MFMAMDKFGTVNYCEARQEENYTKFTETKIQKPNGTTHLRSYEIRGAAF